MKIISEMTGSTENRIVYEAGGRRLVLTRPSRVTLERMREILRSAGTPRAEEAAPAEPGAAGEGRGPRPSAPRRGAVPRKKGAPRAGRGEA